MATVNTSTIKNAVPDPEFVTKSVRFILDRGIMGLGSGILKSVDGNQVAVVLPELHDDDNYSNVDLLKEMMSKFTPKRDTEFMMIPMEGFFQAVSANQPRGLFNIDFVLAYNPSAPSLYILDTTTIPYDWAQAVVFKTEPIDVTAQIVSLLDGDPLMRTLQPANLKNMPWDDFRQTSIRLIVFLSSSSYDSINYQEV
jgi:hypothetical protein